MPRNHDIVAAHYAAGASGDLEGMLAPIEPDTEWVEEAGFPTAGTYVGRQAVLEGVFGALGERFDGFGFELETIIDGGDTQVALGNYRGTARATGKSFDARVAHVWHFRDGKLSRFEQFADSAVVLASLEA